jgi:hypothetical protein
MKQAYSGNGMLMKLTVVADDNTRAWLQRDEFRRNKGPALDVGPCELWVISSILTSNFECVFLYIRFDSRVLTSNPRIFF